MDNQNFGGVAPLPSGGSHTALIIMLSVLVGIILGGGGVYALKSSTKPQSVAISTSPTPTSEPTETPSETPIASPAQSITGCNANNADTCFFPKFAACQPATLTETMEPPAKLGIAYRIFGPVTGGCRMSFQYTSNPNPDFVKEMTCTYDNKIAFNQSVQNVLDGVLHGTVGTNICTGPLYDYLHKLSQSQ